MPPEITPLRTNSIARSSNRRISRTVRYSSAESATLSAVHAAVGRKGRVAPHHGAEIGVTVVGAAIGKAPDQRVVVVGEDLAGAQHVLAVGVLAVLQVEQDGPAGPRAAVGQAAVVGPAVVEAHVALGDDHRDLDDLGVVV